MRNAQQANTTTTNTKHECGGGGDDLSDPLLDLIKLKLQQQQTC
jgi:hypothetical protein